jgi:hypothetical protein
MEIKTFERIFKVAVVVMIVMALYLFVLCIGKSFDGEENPLKGSLHELFVVYKWVYCSIAVFLLLGTIYFVTKNKNE